MDSERRSYAYSFKRRIKPVCLLYRNYGIPFGPGSYAVSAAQDAAAIP
ncbi:hypothetical protein [Mucilaginibacter psychrotolerans]|nr:hypothetical protein [Mucilaginibacter psychrotolerans]